MDHGLRGTDKGMLSINYVQYSVQISLKCLTLRNV